MPIISTDDFSPTELPQSTVRQIYCGLDCCVTSEVFSQINPLQGNESSLIYSFERALQAPVLEMMQRGFRVDQYERQKGISLLRKQKEHLQQQLDCLAHAVWDKGLNPQSTKQLIDFFYHKMRLPEQFKYDKGVKKLSTDRESLEKLELYFYAKPIVSTILEIRNLSKKLSVLETEIDSDGRMRTSYNIAGTETGRWSSSANAFGSGTNLQNIAGDLRKIFISDPGYKLIGIDLEQAESREVGWLCGILFDEWSYLNACYAGDLHTTVTKMVWKNLPWKGDKTSDRRVADEIFYRAYSYRDMSKKLGHGCLTKGHEVLTRFGWVDISDIPDGVEILAWDFISGESFWETPERWTRVIWNGDLYNFEGNLTSLEVTADHRMAWINRRGKKLIMPASNSPKDQKTKIPTTCKYTGGWRYIDEDLCRLHAAFQADGYIDKYNNVSFEFQKDRKITRMRNLLKKIQHTERVSKRGTTVFYIPKASFIFGGKFAAQYLLEWRHEALSAYVDELIFWDGCLFEGKQVISGKNRSHIWWLHFIIRLVDRGSYYNARGNFDVAMLSINSRRGESFSVIEKSKVAHNGVTVYCPTLAAGGFIVKRGDNISLSLNSNYYGTPPTMARHAKIPIKIADDFQKAYFSAFPGIQRWHRWVAQQLQQNQLIITPFGRRRHFFGRPNDDATLRECIAFGPQSATGDRMNLALYRIWRDLRALGVQLIAQVHDAVYFQIPEHLDEQEIITQALHLIESITFEHKGRTLLVPGEAKSGWNWGNWDEKTNPNGLKKVKGKDIRVRLEGLERIL